MSDELPILFTTEMVRKILARAKTNTRRVAKLTLNGYVKEPRGHRLWHPDDPNAVLACPYGQPGRHLWVRETWGLRHPLDVTDWYRGGLSGVQACPDDWVLDYRAHWAFASDSHYWRPSIHMPRWASRIKLELTRVRLGRVQDISEEDAKAEGVTPLTRIGDRHRIIGGDWRTHGTHPYTLAFAVLWDTINADRGYPWAANNLVWALDFKLLEMEPSS